MADPLPSFSHRPRLGELLLSAGLITEAHVRAALHEQRKWGGRLGRTVVEMGFVTEDAMARVLAQQLQLRMIDLDSADLPRQITDCLRLDLAERYGVFPLGLDVQGHTLFLATSDPTNVENVGELEFATNKKIELSVATSSAIDRAVRRYYFGEEPVAPASNSPSQTPSVSETTFELNELLGDPRSALSVPRSRPPSPEVVELQKEVAVLKERVQVLENASASQVRALRVLLELLIESGLVTRDEYVEHLHRP